MEGTFLAVVDADRIQDYIFAPRQLKLIRGASAILLDINFSHSFQLLREYGSGNLDEHGEVTEARLDQNPLQRWEIVYAGGGNVYVLFREEDSAKKFAVAACSLYRKHGVSASATAAYVPWGQSFRATLESAQEAVMIRKSSAATPAQTFSNPYWKICEACGGAPAAHWSRNPVTGISILCAACKVRRSHGQRALYLDEVSPGLRPPPDFEIMAAQARPENYLALVYIDIDRLGRFFEEIHPLAPEDYRKHSMHIRDTIKKGVIAGCQSACATTPVDSCAPFEIILLGGDDAILMLVAQAVRPFLRSFREIFQERLPNLTFSAGVVWAHHHLPIAQYTYHAKDLLCSAKAGGGGRIDYLVVSESMVRGRDKGSRRTMRPYSFEDFDNLFKTIAALKRQGFPSNKAHQLYAMAFAEESQGALDYLCWFSRLEPSHRSTVCRFFPQGLWQEHPRRATGAADLAELWDFVEAE